MPISPEALAARLERMQAKHQALLRMVKRLPTDYADYGGEVVRWSDDGVWSDCSCGCKWAAWLKGDMGSDWCVCTNPDSPRAGLLTFEHMAGRDCFEPEEPRRRCSANAGQLEKP